MLWHCHHCKVCFSSGITPYGEGPVLRMMSAPCYIYYTLKNPLLIINYKFLIIYNFIQMYTLLNYVWMPGKERQVNNISQMLPSRAHLHWGVFFLITSYTSRKSSFNWDALYFSLKLPENNKEIRELSMQEKKPQYSATEDLQGFRSMLNSNRSV